MGVLILQAAFPFPEAKKAKKTNIIAKHHVFYKVFRNNVRLFRFFGTEKSKKAKINTKHIAFYNVVTTFKKQRLSVVSINVFEK